MCEISFPKSDAEARFFHNYLSLLQKHSIPEKQRRWHVGRLESFIKAHKGRKIKLHSGADIDRHLETIGRNSSLQDWQFASGSMLYGFRTATYSHLHYAREKGSAPNDNYSNLIPTRFSS